MTAITGFSDVPYYDETDDDKKFGVSYWEYIPIIGQFFSSSVQTSLQKEMSRCTDVKRLVHLIDISNAHKLASITRICLSNLICLAVIVSIVAKGIFSAISVSAAAIWGFNLGMGFGMMLIEAVAYTLNENSIKELLDTGYRKGMIFY